MYFYKILIFFCILLACFIRKLCSHLITQIGRGSATVAASTEHAERLGKAFVAAERQGKAVGAAKLRGKAVVAAEHWGSPPLPSTEWGGARR
jgi:hypothetical protein